MGRAITPGFLGLSLEYPAVPAYAGKDPKAVNPVFDQPIRNLAPAQSPDLRLGGDTTDDVVARPRRPQVRGHPLLAREDLGRGYRRARARGRARLILGINFELTARPTPPTEAQAMIRGIGRDLDRGARARQRTRAVRELLLVQERRRPARDGPAHRVPTSRPSSPTSRGRPRAAELLPARRARPPERQSGSPSSAGSCPPSHA